MAKAAPWVKIDAHARKRGEQTGLDTLVVHDQAQLSIWALDKHDWSCSRRLGRAYEAVGKVSLDVGLHLHQLHCRLSVEAH